MKRSRQVLAVLALTTVLCVDRVAAPASGAAPQMVDAVRRLAGRLSVSLRRTVPVSQLDLRHPVDRAGLVPRLVRYRPDEPIRPLPLNPFQFRLPPPGN